MKYVQDSKLTDTLERELIRDELAQTFEQPRPFAAVREAFRTFVSVMAYLKFAARRYNVQYANG